MDITFFLDIVLSFRTAFFAPDGDLVTNLGDIAIRYLKGSFIVDLVSTVPLDLVMLAWGGEGSFLRSIRLLRALKLLRLARILRLSSFLEHQEDDVRSFMHPSVWSLTKMLVMLLFIAHLMACMWRWAALLRCGSWTTVIVSSLIDLLYWIIFLTQPCYSPHFPKTSRLASYPNGRASRLLSRGRMGYVWWVARSYEVSIVFSVVWKAWPCVLRLRLVGTLSTFFWCGRVY